MMPFNLHAVVFTEEADKGMKLLKEKYEKNAYKIKNDVMLVASTDLSSQIAEHSSISKKTDDGVRGAVFKLNGSYTGYAQGSLWEWLETVEDS
ncbi:MAG: hypothetical protein OXE94_03955 [Aestuariivita sp.]|nr:hypothetical protein [Aestuariivita sp.]MCY4202583.1 hypothetical protein [Aestuariivita sp.]